ncbi:MAG: DUF1295 domain-containing protein [Devosia sp.]
MDLYGEKSRSTAQKLTVTLLEAIVLAASALVMFWPTASSWAASIGWMLPQGVPARRYLILGFSVVTLGRMAFTMFYLMKRRMPWSEAFTVPFAFAIYYLGFALLVLPSDAPLGLWDALAIGLFLLGGGFNTGGELLRDRFKKDPANKGKLYTGGPFALAMHINFFGDILWVSAYAIVAHTIWAWLIPLFILSFFAIYNVPMLDRHLATHYGEQFERYRARTKRLIPFVW